VGTDVTIRSVQNLNKSVRAVQRPMSLMARSSRDCIFLKETAAGDNDLEEIDPPRQATCIDEQTIENFHQEKPSKDLSISRISNVASVGSLNGGSDADSDDRYLA